MTQIQKRHTASKRRAGWVWVSVLSLLGVELLGYTWCRVQCTRTDYMITEALARFKELNTRENSLNIELARLKAPENISRMARQKLALGMPEPRQIIWVP
jgi:hypothetical protein